MGGAHAKARLQVAALPVRRTAEGAVEVLLVTTRTTQRWSVPKGWPIKGLKSHEAAMREAREEAGIVGPARKKPIGRYRYWKRFPDHFSLCKVKVFVVDAREQLEDWPERGQRHLHWCSFADAAEMVDEPGLKALLRSRRVS